MCRCQIEPFLWKPAELLPPNRAKQAVMCLLTCRTSQVASNRAFYPQRDANCSKSTKPKEKPRRCWCAQRPQRRQWLWLRRWGCTWVTNLPSPGGALSTASISFMFSMWDLQWINFGTARYFAQSYAIAECPVKQSSYTIILDSFSSWMSREAKVIHNHTRQLNVPSYGWRPVQVVSFWPIGIFTLNIWMR